MPRVAPVPAGLNHVEAARSCPRTGISALFPDTWVIAPGTEALHSFEAGGYLGNLQLVIRQTTHR